MTNEMKLSISDIERLVKAVRFYNKELEFVRGKDKHLSKLQRRLSNRATYLRGK